MNARWEDEDFDAPPLQRVEPVPTHKVFVHASHEDEEEDLPRRPISIPPDSSYQEFKKYARRGKRHNRSLTRRVFNVFLLFAVVGGALYFLLGLRKLPTGHPDLPVPPPAIQPLVAESEATPIVVPDTPVASDNPLDFTPNLSMRRGVITGASRVNLRQEHNSSSNLVTRMNANTQVEVLDRWPGTGSGRLPGPWYRIQIGGRQGWVYGDYLQPLGDALPSDYVNALLRTFGDTKSSMVVRLGPPTRNTNTSLEWGGLAANFREERLTRLRVTSSAHTLPNKLKVGMSQEELTRILGHPTNVTQQRQWRYGVGETGLSVQLNNNKAVQSITINEVQ